MEKTILFVVINGVGLGHLTSGLAVARRIRKLNPSLNVVFVTTSLATEIIRENGFMFYYIPSHSMVPEEVTLKTWNQYLEDQLLDIITFYKPIALVYEGDYPYEGLLSVILQHEAMKRIWMKRECYKAGCEEKMRLMEESFDLVIVPKELSIESGAVSGKKRYCEPIMLLDKEEVHEREVVRTSLQLKEGESLFYVQLGVGKAPAINAQVKGVIEVLTRRPNLKILLGESIIGEPIQIEKERVIKIRNYPNAQYFKGIDGAITAAGYNTFHELLYFGIPSLFIPNQEKEMDDQLARVEKAVGYGAALVEKEITSEAILRAVNGLMASKEVLKEKSSQLVKDNGASRAAQWIDEII